MCSWHNVSPAFTTAVFPNCLCGLSSFFFFFFTRTHVNLCNMIVYRDIKIYRSAIKTLHFLERLCSVFPMHFAPLPGTKQPITFICLLLHTITITMYQQDREVTFMHVHQYLMINTSVYRFLVLIWIFMKWGMWRMCPVFAQWATFSNSNITSSTPCKWQEDITENEKPFCFPVEWSFPS